MSLAVYFYKSRESLAPPLTATHNYQTRHRDRLRPPQHRLTLYHNSFLYKAPTFWNKIMTDFPPNVRNARNLSLFKRRLRDRDFIMSYQVLDQ